MSLDRVSLQLLGIESVFSIAVGNNFEISSLLFFDPFFDDPYPIHVVDPSMSTTYIWSRRSHCCSWCGSSRPE